MVITERASHMARDWGEDIFIDRLVVALFEWMSSNEAYLNRLVYVKRGSQAVSPER